MRVILSTAMSVDGYIDDRRETRLLLSSDEDFADVQALRNSCDAIFVGATTIRRDNPSLSPRNAAQRQTRIAQGLSPEPLKITMTRTGNLPPAARFFRDGDGPKLVYHSASAPADLPAEMVAAASFDDIARDLLRRNIARLLVEGGTETATAFLKAGIVDEWRLAVAPFFIGDASAPRAVALDGVGLHDFRTRMQVGSLRQLGDMIVITYFMKRNR